jgi:hypothetical protein
MPGNQLRMMLNMSQEELGKTLGVTFQEIQAYEGDKGLRPCRLQQAVPIEYFFDGAPELSRQARKKQSKADDYIASFLAPRTESGSRRHFADQKPQTPFARALHGCRRHPVVTAADIVGISVPSARDSHPASPRQWQALTLV